MFFSDKLPFFRASDFEIFCSHSAEEQQGPTPGVCLKAGVFKTDFSTGIGA